MKKCFFHFLFCTFLLSAKAQNCKDSVAQLLYSGNNFSNGSTQYNLGKVIADRSNNIFLNWPQPTFNQGITYFTFFKINDAGNLIQKKAFTNNEIYNGPSLINSKSELVYATNSSIQNDPNSCQQLKLLCADSSGLKKWEKKYQNDIGFYIGSNSAVAGRNDEIILTSGFGQGLCGTPAFQKDYLLYKFSSTGDLLLSKRYEITNLNGVKNNNIYIQSNVQLTGTEILMAGGFTYDDNSNLPQIRDGFFLSKIDYMSGKQLLSKSFTFTNNAQSPYRFFLKHIHYDSITKQTVVVARALSYEPWFFLMLLDENFNIIKTKRLLSGVPEAGSNLNHIEVLRDDNTIAICNPQKKDTSITYTIINNQLEIIRQQKIKLSSYYGFYSEFGFAPFFDNTGTLRIRVNDLLTSLSNKMLLLNTADYYKGQVLCYAYDTAYYKTEDAYAKELQVSFWSEDLPPLNVSDVPLSIAEEIQIQTTEVCKKVSTCTSIKISGSKKYCLSDSTGTFNVKINPECIRNIVWDFDTTAFRMRKLLNDTLIQLEFLKPYKGFIYTRLKGCLLKDSIEVEINAPKKAIDLGKDSVLCPQKMISLNAGNGFADYNWQDGSKLQIYTVKKPGIYWVSVVDSCGNFFRDTIIVNDATNKLELKYSDILCREDTATLQLPATFSSFLWQPAEWAIRENNILKVFPPKTTLFTLQANSFEHCNLTDTLLVKVKECPISIFFPNAFTPNNDGLNERYKPVITGQLIKYDLSIFNRWGQLVFRTNKPYESWDGTTKNTQIIPGIYTWICNYTFKNRNTRQEKGNIVLIK